MVVKQTQANNISPQLLMGILESITEAKLEYIQELLDIYEYQLTHYAPHMDVPTRGQIDAMFENLVDEHGGDPFAISETLAQMTRALPLEAQSALIGEFAYSNLPGMKDAVVLLCLNTEEAVRQEALQWLKKNAQFMTPTALRRLIVIRNWLPGKDRKLLDALIKSARIKGVECAQWSTGTALSALQSSQIDGVGAQSMMFSMAVEGRKSRIGAILLKQHVGIADAWITPPISKQEASQTLRQVGQKELFLDISQDYMHAAVRHHIAIGLEKGNPPMVGLLQLAETMAATTWMPERIDATVLVERLIQENQAMTDDLNTLKMVIQTSGVWGEIPLITNSWFEESQEVVTFIKSNRIRNKETLIRRVLDLFCEPNREAWAERFAWTAFWLQEQSAKEKKLVGMDFNFAILARELYRGRPLHELPLMKHIAARTIAGEEPEKFL
ncbi:MAG: hypothetical protein HQL94_05400 [Magnetococcales bacterium]|nr:hypothetical protein [Magnetococcales bacterium]